MTIIQYLRVLIWNIKCLADRLWDVTLYFLPHTSRDFDGNRVAVD